MARHSNADSEHTWNAIVKATRNLLERDGFTGLSLRRVAGLAGVGLSTLQYYFSNKRSLVDVTVAQAYEEEVAPIVAAAIKALEQGESFEDVAPRMTIQFYRFVRSHGDLASTRLTTNLFMRVMSERSLTAHLAATRAVARALRHQSSDGQSLDAARLRVGVHSLVVLSQRYASHGPDELIQLVGATDICHAQAIVEDHLRMVARAAARHALNREP